MKIKILGVLLLLLPFTASAEGLSGFYVGASGGFATIDAGTEAQNLANSIVALGFASASTTIEQSAVNYKVFAGYDFNENFSVEGFYAGLGDYDLTVLTTGPVVSGAGTTKLTAFGADILAKLPIDEVGSVYLRAGYYSLDAETSFTATGPGGVASASGSSTTGNFKLGLGADYRFAENFSVRTDWEYYYDADIPINTFSLGLVAHF